MYKSKLFTGLMAAAGILSTSLLFASDNINITPLTTAEASGGAMCAIVDAKGKTLVDDRIKINGALIPLKTTGITRTTKSMEGKDLEVTFAVAKGKLPEDANGGFTVGSSPTGNLLIKFKGNTFETKAKQECYAP